MHIRSTDPATAAKTHDSQVKVVNYQKIYKEDNFQQNCETSSVSSRRTKIVFFFQEQRQSTHVPRAAQSENDNQYIMCKSKYGNGTPLKKIQLVLLATSCRIWLDHQEPD